MNTQFQPFTFQGTSASKQASVPIHGPRPFSPDRNTHTATGFNPATNASLLPDERTAAQALVSMKNQPGAHSWDDQSQMVSPRAALNPTWQMTEGHSAADANPPTVTPTDPSKWGTHYRNDQIRQLMRKMLDNGVARNTCVADFRLRHHEYTEAVVSEKVLGNMLREICPLEEKIVHKTHRAVKGTKDVDMYKSRPGATADELGMSEDQHAAVKRFVDGEKRKKAHFEALNHGVPSTGSTGVLGAGPRRKALPKATYHKVGDDDSITRNMRENTHLSQEQFCKKFEVSKSQYLRRVKFMSTAVEIAPTPTRAADLTQASTSTSVASNVNTNRPGNQNKFPPFPAFPIILDNVWPPVTPMFNTTDASSRPSLNPSLPYLPPAPRAALAVRTEPGPMPMPNPPGYHSPRS